MTVEHPRPRPRRRRGAAAAAAAAAAVTADVTGTADVTTLTDPASESDTQAGMTGPVLSRTTIATAEVATEVIDSLDPAEALKPQSGSGRLRLVSDQAAAARPVPPRWPGGPGPPAATRPGPSGSDRKFGGAGGSPLSVGRRATPAGVKQPCSGRRRPGPGPGMAPGRGRRMSQSLSQ